MQRNACKINEAHINTIALKARLENNECGYLWKLTSNDSNGKWQVKWFVLYQNFLFYYENVNSTKPSGLILLEGCYCTRNVANSKNTREGEIKLFCFSITYSKDGKNPIEFGAESEHECVQWIEAIKNCSYNRLVSQHAEIHEKYIHLTQLYDTEMKTKWQSIAQIEELRNEVKLLREELRRHQNHHHLLRTKTIADEESADLRRIKKVQSLIRGWLYRRRFKRLVQDYIRSPLAENLRKRNRIVFTLVEREGEYMCQLEILVSNFLRPLKMAACSNKPPITHEEINCIFLNSEILLFLHQIFYKGLLKKLENWPSIFIGDLFDFLLPVLNIYSEYVRNHHYSLQILTELKSKSLEFRSLLKRYEDKPKCESRTLDVFLTYPMHQIPRYILILHELLAHTSQTSPNNVSERNSLENAKAKLEELSKIMHDEVSETENIRCNLAIEKMIVDGCDCLLDANQVFIREGLLIIITSAKSKTLGGKIKDIRKRNVVKCFLFSNHLIITTRATNGKLHLFKPYGVISLSEVKVVEDIAELSSIDEEGVSITSEEISSLNSSLISDSTVSLFSNNDKQMNDSSCEFKLVITRNSESKHILFIASSMSEKQSWCSDISQCIDNLNYSTVLQNTNTSSAVNMPNAEKIDPKLFKDCSDVRYCKTLNSCKVPQIRHASVDKLLERLADLRFLSIDFLNTFLLTYRVFTNPYVVLEALIKLYKSSPVNSVEDGDCKTNGVTDVRLEMSNELSRRVSYTGTRLSSLEEERDIRFIHRHSHIGTVQQATAESSEREKMLQALDKLNSFKNDDIDNETEFQCKLRKNLHLSLGIEHRLALIASCDTMEGVSSISSSSATSSSNFSTKPKNDVQINHTTTNGVNQKITKDKPVSIQSIKNQNTLVINTSFDEVATLNGIIDDKKSLLTDNLKLKTNKNDSSSSSSSLNDSVSSLSSTALAITSLKDTQDKLRDKNSKNLTSNVDPPVSSFQLSPRSTPKSTTGSTSISKPFKFNYSTSSPQLLASIQQTTQKITKKLSDAFTSPRMSLKNSENMIPGRKTSSNVSCGVVVTSGRTSRRRISNTDATKAFAVATSGSSACDASLEAPIASLKVKDSIPPSTASVPFNHQPRIDRINSAGAAIGAQKSSDWVIVNTAASMRVLNVLRHWVTKHPSDFDREPKLKEMTLSLLYEMLSSGNLTNTEKKAANGIIQQLNLPLNKKSNACANKELNMLLAPPAVPGRVKFNDLSVSEIAEQMTYIDYQIFCSIQSEELLGQAWMKPDKEKRAPNVLLFSKRFNEMSQLVVTEIVACTSHAQRLEKLEKWTTIANICRFLKNYNGVLQIMSAFASTSVFRLKKTWERLSKTNQQTVDLLQTLVSSDGRFKNLRDAMHKSDPPCIPYLGMYLMDLVFIEESTPDFADGLINFSKLRMISHIIREIRSFQHSKYTIHYNRRVCEYLTDTSALLSPDEAYNRSLRLEPRPSIVNEFESDI